MLSAEAAFVQHTDHGLNTAALIDMSPESGLEAPLLVPECIKTAIERSESPSSYKLVRSAWRSASLLPVLSCCRISRGYVSLLKMAPPDLQLECTPAAAAARWQRSERPVLQYCANRGVLCAIELTSDVRATGIATERPDVRDVRRRASLRRPSRPAW